MLKDSQIKSLKPTDRLQRVSDGGGLYIEMSPKGVRTFRLTYRFDGSNRTATLGKYPKYKLRDARLDRERIKALVREGVDPEPRKSRSQQPSAGEIRRWTWEMVSGDLIVVPAKVMKKNREHLLPLSEQARSIIEDLRIISGRDKYILMSRTSGSGRLAGNSFDVALGRLGFGKDEHVHHGFRVTASTTLHEQGWNSDWVERQLAHVQINKIKRACNKAQYLDGRRRMMQSYSDWLYAQSADIN